MDGIVTNTRLKFFIRNFVKGMATLALIVLGIVLLKEKLNNGGFDWATTMHPLIIYFSFMLSEILFGIIPPEFFIVYSVKGGLFSSYVMDLAFLSIISVGASILAYNLGAILSYSKWFIRFKERFLKKYEDQLMQYGGFLIFVGAMTPLPYTGICMLVGAYKYPFGKFLLYSSTRFLRYALYGFIIWEALKV